MKVISITGTKGKSSIALSLNTLLLSLKKKVLCISSEGIIQNGVLKKDNEYFLKKFETSANVVALNQISGKKARLFDYVIIESSYSSAKNIAGSFAKNSIDLAVLTNVYWDHIDGKKIKDQKDLLEKKLGLIKNLKKGGSAIIYSGDKKNNFSFKATKILKKDRPDIKISIYNKRLFYKNTDTVNKYYLKRGVVFCNRKPLLKIAGISSLLNNFPENQKNNLLAIIALLRSLKLKPEILVKNKSALMVPGRFNLFQKNGLTVILDYAHEIKSLSDAALFLRKRFPKKKIIIIFRISYYRNIKNIEKLTRQVSNLFDQYIIYDKAKSRPNLKKSFTYSKKAGSVARLMLLVLKKQGKNAKIIYNEFEAIKEGIKRLKKNEVLYVIGDQLEKDYQEIDRELSKRATL